VQWTKSGSYVALSFQNFLTPKEFFEKSQQKLNVSHHHCRQEKEKWEFL
jgi:hypothetical protein